MFKVRLPVKPFNSHDHVVNAASLSAKAAYLYDYIDAYVYARMAVALLDEELDNLQAKAVEEATKLHKETSKRVHILRSGLNYTLSSTSDREQYEGYVGYVDGEGFVSCLKD